MDSSQIASVMHTINTFPFPSGNRSNETCCSWHWQESITALPTSPNVYPSGSSEALTSELPVTRPGSNLHLNTIFPHLGNGHVMPTPPYSGQGTRADLLDTRMWSPYSSFITTHAPALVSPLPLMGMGVISNVSPATLAGSGMAPCMGSIPHALAHMELDSSRTLISSATEYYHTDFETESCHHVSLPVTNNVLASSSNPTGEVANSVKDKKRLPVVIYRPTGKKGSGRRRSRRACAMNIDGIWIDTEELNSAAEQGNNLIVVHECQWAKDDHPCGMWIVGSRSSVGAHVRKWHGHTHTEGRVTCMWDGCRRKMTQGSINRHVVTAHLEECFHCQGCEQTFSRKDVYDQHVQKEEACKDGGAAVVYGTERRVIDIHEALQQEGALRYSG